MPIKTLGVLKSAECAWCAAHGALWNKISFLRSQAISARLNHFQRSPLRLRVVVAESRGASPQPKLALWPAGITLGSATCAASLCTGLGSTDSPLSLLKLRAVTALQVEGFLHHRWAFKLSSNTPVMQRTRRAHKESGRYAPHNISLASCPSGRHSGWAVRRFDSLVLSEVPDVVLCLSAQGEGAFFRIAP